MTDAHFGRPVDLSAGHHRLGQLAWAWRDVQQVRIALTQRGGILATEIAPKIATIEGDLGRLTVRELHRQPIYPWLSQFPGLRGVHVARLVALIGDPRRFPGQRCTAGHTSVPAFSVGDLCPVANSFGACDGLMLLPRPGPGVRSLWHYLGLHVVEGRSPRKTRGQKADWNPIGRTIVLQPDGIADQIVRQRTEPYRGVYEKAKSRLVERGPEGADSSTGAADLTHGALRPGHVELTLGSTDDQHGLPGPEAVDINLDREKLNGGLKPFQIDALARKIAAKAFVADLLTEWKRLLAVDAAAAA